MSSSAVPAGASRPGSSSSTRSRVASSSAEVASSQTSRAGRAISARASAQRCNCPPDSPAGRLPSWAPSSPSRAPMSRASPRAASGDSPRSSRPVSAICASIGRCASKESAALWCTYWTARRCAATGVPPCGAAPRRGTGRCPRWAP
nr:hypothetical protein [Actinomadura sp. CNU-125]